MPISNFQLVVTVLNKEYIEFITLSFYHTNNSVRIFGWKLEHFKNHLSLGHHNKN